MWACGVDDWQCTQYALTICGFCFVGRHIPQFCGYQSSLVIVWSCTSDGQKLPCQWFAALNGFFRLKNQTSCFPTVYMGWVINYRWFNGNILMQYHSVHCLFPLRCDQHLENGAVCTALAAAFRMILRNHAQGRSSPSISWFSSIIRSVSASWTQFLWNIPKMFVRFMNICQSVNFPNQTWITITIIVTNEE